MGLSFVPTKQQRGDLVKVAALGAGEPTPDTLDLEEQYHG